VPAELPPPGFKGLDQFKPIARYRRHLPHWRQDGATYFVTFRLFDSLPKEKLQQLSAEIKEWHRLHPEPTDQEWEEYHNELFIKVDRWLDLGHGCSVLGEERPQTVLSGALTHFDHKRYELYCYVIMPNHVHLVVRPWNDYTLEQILHSWKRYSARQINRHVGRTGTLWQEESFDRIVRDTQHLRRVLRYIEKNPGKLGKRCPFWLTPKWEKWYRAPYGE